MAKKPAKKTAPMKKNRMAQVMGWILAPPLAYVFHPTLIVAIVGMIPTFVAYIIDNRPQRYAARTVGYMNFAGVIIVSVDIWSGDNTWQGALDLISQPVNWLIMFGTAAVGWVFYFIAPPFVFAYLTVANEVQSKQLRSDQKDLLKEWGDEVKTDAPSMDDDAVAPEGSVQIEGPSAGKMEEPDGVEDDASAEELADALDAIAEETTGRANAAQ